MDQPERLFPSEVGDCLGRDDIEPTSHCWIEFTRFQGAVADGVENRAEAICSAKVVQAVHVVGVQSDDTVTVETKGLVRSDPDDLPGESAPEVKERIITSDSRDPGDQKRQADPTFISHKVTFLELEIVPVAPSLLLARSGQCFGDSLAIADEAKLALDVMKLRTGIDTEEMEDGGGQIANRNRPFFGVCAVGIGGTDDNSALHSRTCKNDGVAITPMIAPANVVGIVREGDTHTRSSAKFSHPDDKHLIEHSPVGEVFYEGAERLIGRRHQVATDALDVLIVSIPTAFIDVGVREDGDERNSCLDKSASEQGALTDGVSAITIAPSTRFARQVKSGFRPRGHEKIHGPLLECAESLDETAPVQTTLLRVEFFQKRSPSLEAIVFHVGGQASRFDTKLRIVGVRRQNERIVGGA